MTLYWFFRESTSEVDTEQGRETRPALPPRKASSLVDLSRGSPGPSATRVRFQDEIHHIGGRTMSHPDVRAFHEVDTDDHVNAMRGFIIPSVVRNLQKSQSHDGLNHIHRVQNIDLPLSISNIPSPRYVHTSDRNSILSRRGSLIVLPPEDFQDPVDKSDILGTSNQGSNHHSDFNHHGPQRSSIHGYTLSVSQASLTQDVDYSNQILDELNASLEKKSRRWRHKGNFKPSESGTVVRPTQKPPKPPKMKGKTPSPRSTPSVGVRDDVSPSPEPDYYQGQYIYFTYILYIYIICIKSSGYIYIYIKVSYGLQNLRSIQM